MTFVCCSKYKKKWQENKKNNKRTDYYIEMLSVCLQLKKNNEMDINESFGKIYTVQRYDANNCSLFSMTL